MRVDPDITRDITTRALAALRKRATPPTPAAVLGLLRQASIATAQATGRHRAVRVAVWGLAEVIERALASGVALDLALLQAGAVEPPAPRIAHGAALNSAAFGL